LRIETFRLFRPAAFMPVGLVAMMLRFTAH
jgi:hypothetical protein